MKTHPQKFTVAAIAIAISFLAACKKDQSSGSGQTPVSSLVNYKVTDRMQVNNQDGKPRAIDALPVINTETIAIGNGALNAGQVTLKNADGENLLLNVVDNGGGKLTLAQTYPTTDGLASGTIYYALNKN